MGIPDGKRQEGSSKLFKISPNTTSMENSPTMLESKESGVRYKSVDFDLLESQILCGDWDNCIDTVNKNKDVKDDSWSSVLFLVFKQYFLEYLNRGYDSLV
ncbi:hypothetical protein REPUB_Repub12eG0093500 [Reevesia pubescens]